jgi:superfamily II DNA or RNA helicase
MSENVVEVRYNQTKQSKKHNELGMREMQERAYEARAEQYLLIKSPPASGKSRALMFIALDKLLHQDIKKVIVAVPEKSIGGSFGSTDLTSFGFEADWEVNEDYNLCTIESNESRSAIFERFLENDEQILVCTHSTLRNAFETLDESRFNDTLVAIDEFHHLSASEANVLGNVLKSIISKSNAHIVAMTGSYFRGDSDPILLPEIEELFAKITYSYYDQLNGYEYLETLGMGYHFYKGNYLEAIDEVLDVNKKTIIHIPSVNSRESTQRGKYDEVGAILDIIGEHISTDEATGILTMKTKEGKMLRVADLVDEDGRERVQKYLREVKGADDIDIIIALGMAKEGFDWEYCEHALTVGYRGSLTEIIQIIGRATRDSKGKNHAQFTNLVAEPDATQDSVGNATNDMLKAITASLLMEQVLAPNFKFKPKSADDKEEKKGKGFEIRGLKEPSTKRTKEIIEQDLTDLTAKIFQDATMKKTMGSDINAKVVTQQLIPKIIEESYPDLDKTQVEEVRQHLLATNFLKGSEFDANKNELFVKSVNKFVDIKDLSIDLIDSINPFQRAYEILSKSVSKETLKLIQETIDANRSTVTEEEAIFYWKDINKFFAENRREPNKNSHDEHERKLAEVLTYIKAIKRKEKQK